MPKSPNTMSPFEDPRQRLGLQGEEAAMAYLAGQGWSIEAHRFRMGRLEIDLVARLGALVAFVEVKTRRGNAYGAACEAIGWRKRQAIGRVAEAWRHRKGRVGDTYRFDVIEVLLQPTRFGGNRVNHIPDAWRL
jgi:putative endonuclease